MSYAIRQSKHSYHLPHGIRSTDTYSVFAPIAQAIWITTAVVIELLAIRFMIAFLGANPGQTVFHYIYSVSQPLVNPFVELTHQAYPGSSFYRFEAPTLLAIAVYAAVGYGLAKLLTSHNPHID